MNLKSRRRGSPGDEYSNVHTKVPYWFGVEGRIGSGLNEPHHRPPTPRAAPAAADLSIPTIHTYCHRFWCLVQIHKLGVAYSTSKGEYLRHHQRAHGHHICSCEMIWRASERGGSYRQPPHAAVARRGGGGGSSLTETAGAYRSSWSFIHKERCVKATMNNSL